MVVDLAVVTLCHMITSAIIVVELMLSKWSGGRAVKRRERQL